MNTPTLRNPSPCAKSTAFTNGKRRSCCDASSGTESRIAQVVVVSAELVSYLFATGSPSSALGEINEA
ncbi:MAG TPA: hypothetical protein VK745_03670 [Polyangiaceae bacterium]|nr:hypothetical protein [Polyangiaceae bacterium]